MTVRGFLGHGPREYHIALSEALSEAAVASVSEWLRLFSPAAGQHPKCRAAGSDRDRDPPLAAQRLAAIPSPGGPAATRAPGSVGTVRLRLRVVLNLINPSPSRAQSTGNQIYPSHGSRDRQLTDLRFSSVAVTVVRT
jgi:hypothetical protein